MNPFAELLHLPDEVLKPRRTNAHYLQFIEAITFYHQRQRAERVDETTGEVYIETTIEDIEEANRLLGETLLRKSDELTGACRNYLERVKSYLEQEAKTQFTNREIRKALKENTSNQKRYNVALVSGYYIRQVKGKKGTAYSYEIVSYDEFKALRNQVVSVLDENVKKLDQLQPAALKGADRATGSQPVQTKNEPVKRKKAN